MADIPIAIRLAAHGGPDVLSWFNRVSAAGRGMGSALQGAATASTQSSRVMVSNARNITTAFQDTIKTFRQMQGAVRSGRISAPTATSIMSGRAQGLDAAIGGFAGEKAKFSNISAVSRGAMLAGGGMLALGGGMAFAGGHALADAGQWQMYEIAFTKMMGSADKGKAKLKELSDFASKTPFTMQGLVGESQKLMAMGFSSGELIPTLTSLGDAMAGLGQGEDVMDRVVYNLGQVRAQGHATGADLRQFAMAGINWQEILQLGTGRNINQEEAVKMDQAEFIPAFQKGLEMKFGGLMEQQNQTLPGGISNLQDAIFRLNVAITTYLIPPINWVIREITALANWFANLPGPIRAAIAYGAAFVTGLIFIGGGLLVVGGIISGAIVNILALAGATATEGAVAGTAAAGTNALSVALMGRLIPALGSAMLAIGQMALIALAAAVVMYGIDKLLHWREDKKLQESIKKGDEVDRQFYDTISEKHGGHRPGESFEDWKKRTGRGSENSEDMSDMDTQQAGIEKMQAQAQAQMAAFQQTPISSAMASGTETLAPSTSGIPATGATITSGGASIDSIQAAIDARRLGKSKDPESVMLSIQMRNARRAEQAEKKAARDKEHGRKHAESEHRKAQRQKEQAAKHAAAFAFRQHREIESEGIGEQIAGIQAAQRAGYISKDDAAAQIRGLRANYRREAVGLSPTAASTGGGAGIGMAAFLRSGGSLINFGGNGAVAGSAGGIGGANPTMEASLVSQSQRAPGLIDVLFKGTIRQDDLSRQAAAL